MKDVATLFVILQYIVHGAPKYNTNKNFFHVLQELKPIFMYIN